jgi:hypothetical protein
VFIYACIFLWIYFFNLYGKYENRLNKYTKCFNFKIIINMIYYIGLYIYLRNSTYSVQINVWNVEDWKFENEGNWWEECVMYL